MTITDEQIKAVADTANCFRTNGQYSIIDLLPLVMHRAEKGMLKFPQPNYVISKWAEETGEVTKAAIHFAEGRERGSSVVDEIIDALAMLHRLCTEGDKVHGMDPLGPHIFDYIRDVMGSDVDE